MEDSPNNYPQKKQITMFLYNRIPFSNIKERSSDKTQINNRMFCWVNVLEMKEDLLYSLIYMSF